MQIGGSFPVHVARAYGVPPTSAPRPVAAAARPAAPAPVAAAAPPAAPANANIEQLVAGRVNEAVGLARGQFGSGFDPRTAPAAAGGSPYQLYTRAADKIEAAVAVQVGRTVDIKG